jgi:hypothetical protein
MIERLAVGVRHTLVGRYPLDLTNRAAAAGGPYPLDWRGHVSRHPDPNHVPMARAASGHYLNPVSVALYALACHSDDVHEGRRGSAEAFLAQARVLLETQDDLGGWRYPIAVSRYGVAPGWYSGMAQGLAVSVFLRAHAATGQGEFHAAAKRAHALMLRPVVDGGCAVLDGTGRPFIEECPSDPPSRILNGAAFALIGWAELDPPGAVPAINLLAELLPEYDNGFWSTYDLRYRVAASYAYHKLHVSQLAVLAHLSGDGRFLERARRWQRRARHAPSRLRAAAEKAGFAIRRRWR